MCRSFLSFSFVCLVASLVLFASSEAKNKRIVEIPYVVQLRDRNEDVFCGGTLISPQHVLTASGCIENRANDITVVGGANTRLGAGQKRGITDYVLLSRHARGRPIDVALLKLDGPMEGNNIGTLELCSRPWLSGDLIEVSGWSREGLGELRSLNLPRIAHAECVDKIGSRNTDSAMECTYNGARNPCIGNPGLPAVIRDELCGIVSSHSGCVSGDNPNVYTNIYEVRDYITDAMKSL